MMLFWTIIEWIRRRFDSQGGRRISFTPYRCKHGHVTPSRWLVHDYRTERQGRGEDADYDAEYVAHCPKCRALVYDTGALA